MVEHNTELLEKLNQERELYADLANVLPAGMYRTRVFANISIIGENWSSSQNTPYLIEYANARFYEILQLERDAFLRNPGIINDLIFEDDKAEFAKMNVEANLKVTPFTWEGRFNIKDTIIWIHFESIPRCMENGDIIWTGVLYDISKRKQTELDIAAKNRELEQLNAEKDKFFSIIAHDLKSPFNSIIGFCDLLIGAINKKNFDKSQHYAAIIAQSSNKAMDLLNNLMEWAQARTGRVKFKPEHIEISDYITEITELYFDIAGQKSITISNHLPWEFSIFADKAMISTVFRNLISNALKFTMPGGKVLISAIKDNDEIIFSVQDTGIGISGNRVEKIFNIDRAKTTLGTNNEEGTGLGLILCKEFVEIHGGKIRVESEDGLGSTFYFTLPYTVKT